MTRRDLKKLVAGVWGSATELPLLPRDNNNADTVRASYRLHVLAGQASPVLSYCAYTSSHSVNERGDTVKGSTTSLGSAINSQPSSRSSSIGPENGDIDYKKLYEEQLEENFKVRERLRGTETELRQSREAVDLNTKKCNTRLAMAEADKREKRALERKLSEMEEELKLLEQLKQENQRLKDENGALIRVISKLSK
ncbi:phosphatase 1 regulatory subunit 12A-like 1 [Homarus americanus]|uniref:Phosphatase 1 regulatory subunit 12A-like 1 n=1 Tax=Homarus americanus TaxID=6706 RepID=A0A8J5MSR9_HOMAM|nr:phosphatase 1 regulatory subunit 12A-like 1 [Homarus americanus]